MALPTAGASTRHNTDSTVGDYIVGKEIGQGSFANVYLASHKVCFNSDDSCYQWLTLIQRTKDTVAIKAVRRDKLTPKLLENLESEIAILKGIRHDHVVILMDCQTTQSHIHLIMEYCALGDLSKYIKKRDKLPEFTEYSRNYPNPIEGGLNEYVARHYLKQLASAIRFMRSQNLIHRDVKPQNLLLQPPPAQFPPNYVGATDLPMLKLADFGFARFLPSTSLAETLCGSPLYMAPEILRFEKYDAKADLWSVGTVLYEMIVGKAPFRAQNHVELLRKIEKGQDRIKFPDEVSTSSSSNAGAMPIGLAAAARNSQSSAIVGSAPARTGQIVTRSPISADIKQLLRLLLKRNPTERISFDEFFRNETIADDLSKYKPTTELVASMHAQKAAQTSPVTQQPERPNTFQQRYFMDAYERNRPAEIAPETSAPPNHPSTLSPAQAAAGIAQPTTTARRPSLSGHNASERQITTLSNANTSTPPKPRRTVSEVTMQQPPRRQASTGMSPQRTPPSDLRTKQLQRQHSGKAKAEDDVLFEREYVVVEKRTVEVNALADELAASPHGGALTHRPKSIRVPSRSPPSSTTNIYDPSLSRRSSLPQMSPNYFLNATPPFAVTGNSSGVTAGNAAAAFASPGSYSPSSSPSGALAKAIANASARLFGNAASISPPFRTQVDASTGRMLDDRNTPMPQNALVLFSDQRQQTSRGRTSSTDPAEAAVVNSIEDLAKKAFSVFKFADEKFSLLIPPKPGSSGSSRRTSIEGRDTPQTSEKTATPSLEVSALTAEEALVLYLKALTLLQNGMDTAKAYWFSGSADGKPTKTASSRLNIAVQWTRDRFNECLEKAEFVKSKCLIVTDSTPTSSMLLSSGIFPEKLIYDRALEMSRKAAVNELVGDELDACEQAYELAIWMLKAILDPGTVPSGTDASSLPKVMDDDDRKTIEKFVASILARLTALRKKRDTAGLVRDAMKANQGMSPRSTSTSPSSRPVMGSAASSSSSMSRRSSSNTQTQVQAQVQAQPSASSRTE